VTDGLFVAVQVTSDFCATNPVRLLERTELEQSQRSISGFFVILCLLLLFIFNSSVSVMIIYELCTVMHSVVHGQAPSYISDIDTPVTWSCKSAICTPG